MTSGGENVRGHFPFSSSMGERKLMNYFVVKYPFPGLSPDVAQRNPQTPI
jgi:hypothetical protein